jgi:hypothetical protein
MAKKRVQPSEAEPPTSSCLLICEDILVSPSRDKHYLQGVISKIVVPKFPAMIGPLAAYVRLSNIYGSQQIEISFTSGEYEKPIFSFVAISPPSSNPLETQTIMLGLPVIKLKKTGRYLFSASHGGVPFATTTVEVVLLEKKRGKK